MTEQNHLKIGSRVQTKIGLTRHGTVVGLRVYRDRHGNPTYTLDVRWDDDHGEVCSGVGGSNVTGSSVIDALADLINRPKPEVAPRPAPTLFGHDLVVTAHGGMPEAGRLSLGFAFMAGDDDLGAWW
jgi:hypothetical protein